MNNHTFLQIQAAELAELLQKSHDDPILAPQLRERLEEVQQELQSISRKPGELWPKENVILPRAALFLRGGGVRDSEGIRPGLAGDVLIQYEKMFIERALHDERVAAKEAGRQRRRRGAPTPSLLFTGTPRGSFGLEFTPQITEGDNAPDLHARTLQNLADDIVRVAGGDPAKVDETIRQIPSRVLQPLKQFLRTLAQHDAELRLAFPDKASRSLSSQQIKTAAEQLERELKQETVELTGVFRGMTHETLFFDLKSEEELITGTVDDTLTDDDIERIASLYNKSCVATLQKTTVTKISGATTTDYVLLDARDAIAFTPAVTRGNEDAVPTAPA